MENAVKYFANRARQTKKNVPVPNKYIGGGVQGRAFSTTNGRIIKFSPYNLTREYDILKKLRGKGVAPNVNNLYKLNLIANNANMFNKVWPGEKGNIVHMLVMKRVGNMTLGNYYKEYKPNKTTNKYIQNYINWLVHQLQLAGIEHMNLHSGNIMVSVDSKGKITNMWIIDYGLSKHYPVGKVVPRWNFQRNNHREFLPKNKQLKLTKIIANMRKQRNKKSPARTRSARSNRKKSTSRTRSAHM